MSEEHKLRIDPKTGLLAQPLTPPAAPAQSWVETSFEEAEEQHQRYLKEAGRPRANRPPDGRSVWRALPARADSGSRLPYTTTWVHFVKNPHNMDEILAVGECPNKVKNEPCRICAEAGHQRRLGNKEYADSLRAGYKVYMNVVRCDLPGQSVEVMDVPITVYNTLKQALMDPDPNNRLDFAHPTNGRNFIIVRTGKDKGTKYTASFVPRSSALTSMDLLNDMPDLRSIGGELNVDGADKWFADPGQPSAGALAPMPAGDQQLASAEDFVMDPNTGEWVPAKK